VIAEADVLLCQQEIPMETVHAALRAGRAGGTRTILNAAPARDLPDGLLDEVDLLVVNELEAQAITGGSVIGGSAIGGSAPEMAALLALVPRVVLTLSGSGARYADRDGRDEHVPAFPVEVADTTAAGDAFTGALAVAWGEGRDLLDAVRWANAAGAACVQRVGASGALPERAEIEAIYAKG
jgi:ribokinase